MDPWTIFSILGVVIPSVVFKKLKRLIYYKIPDWLTYGLQFLWYKIRKFCKPTRIHIPSGGRQFYKIIVQNSGSYFSNWLCRKLHLFIVWWQSRLDKKWTYKI